MKSCPKCNSSKVQKYGMKSKIIMSKEGKSKQNIQKYKCENGHIFQDMTRELWSDSFVEHVVFVYLKSLSLNTTIEIVREYYEENILSKSQILDFLNRVSKAMPSINQIDEIFKPKRSGYLAFDGTWLKFSGKNIVLLVCFDPETFDVIEARWALEENKKEYVQLIDEVLFKLPKSKIRGVYADGDNGLIAALKERLEGTPFQMCVVHKEMRMGQLIPVKMIHRTKKIQEKVKSEIETYQSIFRSCIYAKTKEESIKFLKLLGDFVTNIEGTNKERFEKSYRALNKNFKYTLTHFDHENMMRDNNLLECFNGCLKPRLRLMKSFKKAENLDMYLKLFLLDFRFHKLKESRFKDRRNKSPLEMGGVKLPKYWNFMKLLREKFSSNY